MPTIEFRIDVTGIPHSFVILGNGAGFESGYGFAPETGLSLWGDGAIHNDTDHPFDYTTGPITVSIDQYNAIVAQITHDISNPPYYNLPGSIVFRSDVLQCAQWVASLAQIGGMSLPFTLTNGGWNPYGQAILLSGATTITYTQISPTTATLFTASTFAAPPRRDPLVLDLDGDGIETVGLNATTPLMFDIDASGIKKSVGWLKADDGFLVRDINGNGLIDSGAELFGDATALSTGGKAADGFSALADLDSNHDGKINSLDNQFANLRVWRDLNQDGISQSNELTTLTTQGIIALNVAATSHGTQLTNGNQILDLGSYTTSAGQSGGLGETAQSGDINFAVDTFHSQFIDTLNTGSVATLPDMQGAGQVRDLRQAASLSPTLAALLSQFAAADTRSAQMALIDRILNAWSATSTMPTTFTGAYAGHALSVDIQNFTPGSPAYQAWQDKLTLLEHFNGRTFNPVPSGSGAVTLNLWTTTQGLLQQSYDALKNSVYDGLVMQTRLKPYLDLVGRETAIDVANDSEWRRVG